MSAQILDQRIVHDGWNRLMIADVRTRRGTAISRAVEDHGAAAAVLPYDPKRGVCLLVRQLRVPLLLAYGLQSSLEVPAGLIDGGEPAEAARREAMEEAGLRLTELRRVASVFPMPGVSTERIDIFLAEYGELDRMSAGGGVDHENEEIEVLEMPLADLAALARQGKLSDLKTLALLQALQLSRPELF